jgi:penicillin-binding protein 1A
MGDGTRRTRRLAAGLLGAALLSVGCSYTTREVLPPTASAQSSTLYAADGTLVRTFHAEENRRDVELAQVPLDLRHAVVAIEDERFYRHHGVDLRALVRAVRANAESGGVSEGGSTITQQYVKQVLLRDDSRTAKRKLQEASLALQLERRYSKDRILELYLNAVYFGNGAYGVAAAAQQYFGKPVQQLDLAQSALLAGLIQRPTATDPFDAPEAATARRNVVLDRMARNDYATQAAVDAAKAEPLDLASATTPAAERYPGAYFVQQVQDWILGDPRFGATRQDRRNLLFEGGLKIRTTIDLEAQAAAEAAARSILPDEKDPDVALVSIDPGTGEVKAMVGGRDFFGAGQAAKVNLATRGRQAGSSFKPFVLATALAQGMPASTSYPAPGCILLPRWDPKKPVCNYSDGEAFASANLVEGTVHSLNTLYAQLMLDVGPKPAMAMAKDLGIRSPLAAVPSAVLGTNDVTAVDMASAYGTFANRGMQVDPIMVTRITRADGTVLYRHEEHEHRVLDADVADTVTAILQQVVTRGTGTAASLGAQPVAGKTGTADDHHDAWFVGYTPQLVTSVWVGFHEGQIPMEPPKTPIAVVGGSYPARIWKAYMAAALADAPVEQFHPAPPGAFASAGAPVEETTTTFETLPGQAPFDPGDLGLPGTPRSTTTTSRSQARFVPVPDVTGRPTESAVFTLRSAGFSVVKRTVRGEVPGLVLSQTPAGGSLQPQGSTVFITVSQ